MQILAIIEVADDTIAVSEAINQVTVDIRANYGPIIQQEFETAFEESVQARADWDTFVNAFTELLIQQGVLTAEGFTANGYSLWSILDFVKRGIKMLPESVQDNNTVRIIRSGVKTALLPMKRGKAIELDSEQLQEFFTTLADVMIRQTMRDEKRRVFLNPIVEKAKAQLSDLADAQQYPE